MDALAYTRTVINEVVEAGFKEGGKLKKTHVVIERNSQVRSAFFKANPTSACDLCSMDTKATYPWSTRVLDLHHLLPLASGRRTDNAKGTIFTDLVPVCPSCHRGIHRFYDKWLSENTRRDFETADEARSVYQSVKSSFQGHQYV
jgi:predicted HNH restriction endonuclease